MSKITRIGVALESELLHRFDRQLERKSYTNRSEAFRDLIRDSLSRESAEDPKAEIVGTLTLIYDHHQRLLNDKLVSLQHEFHDSILSTVHVHLDHHNCLEVLLLRGPSGKIRAIADRIVATKGIKHGQLTVTSAALAQVGCRDSGQAHAHD
jgi:CopG family nickel-responsive transcriptional regulator